MKILAENDHSPIAIMPGDTISVQYDDGTGNPSRTVVSKTVTEGMIVDRAVVVQLDDKEAASLNMNSGALGGVVGKKT